MPDMKDTAVTRWLTENDADATLIQTFFDQGFYNLSDIEEADLDEFVKGKKGLLNRLKASLAAAKQASAPRPTGPDREPLPPPNLPAGEAFDLSAPTLEHANVKFEVPSELQVQAGDAPRAPADLKNEEWMVIAKYAKLIYGFDMSGPTPARPREPVYFWKVPAEDSNFVRNEEDHGEVTSAVTYSSDTTSYVRAGFDKEAATASYPFCSASIERSHKERQAQAQSRVRCDMTGFWRYPRATVFLDDCMTVSPKFVAAVETALKAADPKDALAKALVVFGHAAPTEVLIGGQLIMKHSEEDASFAHNSQYEDVISAAVDIKAGAGSGSASTTVGKGGSDASAAERIAQSTAFDAVGGNTLLASSPAQWAPTLAAPDRWAVIENRKIVSTLDLLEEGLREKARAFWPQAAAPLPDAFDVAPNGNDQADTDGFLSAWLNVVSEGDGSEVYAYSDASADPQTRRASAGAHWYKLERVQHASLFMPVRANDFYKLQYSPRWGTPVLQGRFQPIPLGLGPWEPLKLNERIPARDHDGFVVLDMRYRSDGDRAYAIGRQGPQLTPCAASSFHWYDHSDVRIATASLCMPVPAGQDVQVDYVKCQNCGVDAFWVPMGKTRRMLPLERRTPDTVNEATTDGMLFGFLAAGPAQGFMANTSALILDVAATRDFQQPTTLSMACAMMSLVIDKQVPYAFAGAIVPGGRFYRASFGGDQGASANVFWVPIVSA